MKILTLDRIRPILPHLDLVPLLEGAFVAFSDGRANIPPVGELLLEKGEVHIKYGAITGEELYVVKIASGFYDNPSLGLPSSDGLMLLFDQQTGRPAAILLDEGHLTDVRTAVAGAIAAKHLAPTRLHRIGILGTGIQARLQAIHLKAVTGCRELLVWGRGEDRLGIYRGDLEAEGFSVEVTREVPDLLARCGLVVTTTPSKTPLLSVDDLRPGVHITAVGADTPEKRELDPAILGRADRVVVDSLAQGRQRGELHHALAAGLVAEESVVELGAVIAGRDPGRSSEDEITVADLTGVAVQDIKIAEAVYRALE